VRAASNALAPNKSPMTLAPFPVHHLSFTAPAMQEYNKSLDIWKCVGLMTQENEGKNESKQPNAVQVQRSPPCRCSNPPTDAKKKSKEKYAGSTTKKFYNPVKTLLLLGCALNENRLIKPVIDRR
jgi:hypothetical protein